MKGHSWGYPGVKGTYNTPEAEHSLRELKATAAEWVAICFAVEMETAATPVIRYGADTEIWVRDAELIHAIEYAKSLGLNVVLKPMVNCRDQTWRARIDFKDAAGNQDLAQWEKWWQSFQEMLQHYGQIAEQTGCAMYCLGCEMESTEPFTEQWRATIAQVREIYSGVLTYDVNFTIPVYPEWFDALDLISLSAYYHIGVEDVKTVDWKGAEKIDWQARDSVAEKRDYLRKQMVAVKAQCERFQLPILFIETGVCSAAKASRHPWKHPNQVEQLYDGTEQAKFYQAMLEEMWDEPWFVGFCWWSWPAKLYDRNEAETKIDFSIYGKPAEELVRDWYSRPTPVRPAREISTGQESMEKAVPQVN